MKHDLKERYSLNVMWSDEDEGFIATCSEFEDLSAFGETRDEAVKQAQDAIEGFIESYEARGRDLPTPIKRTHYSGQLRLRMPKSLHRRVAKMAQYENVSLNTLLLALISQSLEQREGRAQLMTEALMGIWRKASYGNEAKYYTMTEPPPFSLLGPPAKTLAFWAQ